MLLHDLCCDLTILYLIGGVSTEAHVAWKEIQHFGPWLW